MKSWIDETMTFTQQSQPFPSQFCFSYTVKSVQTENINISNVLNTSVTITINEHQDTKYLIVPELEASDFNHSGGYFYEPSLFCNMPNMLLLTLFHIWLNMHFPQGGHALYIC